LNLETLVGRYGPVTPARAVPILFQICHSLAEAHERGLIHRDIKPANIFLCRYGREFDFVKVLDFGLVKTREDTAGTDPGLTAGNVVGGTPAFMAPEQALGGKDVDGRTDLYALGCVAYWLLTGHLVFESDTVLEMITRHLRDAPMPPSKLTEIAIPPELDQIILECLEKRPEDRPRGAVQLAQRLAAVEIPEKWTGEEASDWWETHQPTAHID
jgi:serine/threonine-protein kinase